MNDVGTHFDGVTSLGLIRWGHPKKGSGFRGDSRHKSKDVTAPGRGKLSKTKIEAALPGPTSGRALLSLLVERKERERKRINDLPRR